LEALNDIHDVSVCDRAPKIDFRRFSASRKALRKLVYTSKICANNCGSPNLKPAASTLLHWSETEANNERGGLLFPKSSRDRYNRQDRQDKQNGYDSQDSQDRIE
jgi:hypothetical protein